MQSGRGVCRMMRRIFSDKEARDHLGAREFSVDESPPDNLSIWGDRLFSGCVFFVLFRSIFLVKFVNYTLMNPH